VVVKDWKRWLVSGSFPSHLWEAMATQQVVVDVPQGCTPGQVIQVNVNGAIVAATIPPGVAPGGKFAIMVPVAQNVAQALPIAGGPGTAGTLECLRNIPGVWVFQQFKVEEMLGWEAGNTYNIFTKTGPGKADVGPQLFRVLEKSGCFERQCWGPGRELTLNMHAFDPMRPQGPYNGVPLAMFHKEFHCQGCCCDCLRPKFQVHDGSGAITGRVHDPFKCCIADNRVFDASGNQVYLVSGAILQTGCCCPCLADFTFDVKDMTGQHVGSMGKAFRGCAELLVQCNKFWVDFPATATPQEKALLIGSLFCLDFEYFEIKKN